MVSALYVKIDEGVAQLNQQCGRYDPNCRAPRHTTIPDVIPGQVDVRLWEYGREGGLDAALRSHGLIVFGAVLVLAVLALVFGRALDEHLVGHKLTVIVGFALEYH